MVKKEILVKKTIDVPANDVWETLRSFDRVERYVPIVKSSTIQGSGAGCQRTCSVQFGQQEAKLVEKLEYLDDDKMLLQFSISEAPTPFQGLQFQIQIISLDEAKSEVQISTKLQNGNSEAIKMIQDIFQMTADGLKKLHENKVGV